MVVDGGANKNMREIVINTCYGGFGLSDKAIEMFCDIKKQKGESDKYTVYIDDFNGSKYMHPDPERDDVDLVKVVKKLKKESFGYFAELKIVKIAEDIDWEIDADDGAEDVVEKHRRWC